MVLLISLLTLATQLVHVSAEAPDLAAFPITAVPFGSLPLQARAGRLNAREELTCYTNPLSTS